MPRAQGGFGTRAQHRHEQGQDFAPQDEARAHAHSSAQAEIKWTSSLANRVLVLGKGRGSPEVSSLRSLALRAPKRNTHAISPEAGNGGGRPLPALGNCNGYAVARWTRRLVARGSGDGLGRLHVAVLLHWNVHKRSSDSATDSEATAQYTHAESQGRCWPGVASGGRAAVGSHPSAENNSETVLQYSSSTTVGFKLEHHRAGRPSKDFKFLQPYHGQHQKKRKHPLLLFV